MKKLLIGTGILIATYFIYSSISSNTTESTEDYIVKLETERQDKNQFMSKSNSSPFAIYGDTTVTLDYYPVDPAYKVNATVELIEKKQSITLGASDGESVQYRKYAYARFEINEQALQLLILKNTDTGDLFTAFADKTSTEETYGAGRYLDLNFKRAKRITIDFNLAYNPYCNYNHEYSCPFPPAENLLDIAITVGEKDYSKD
ncbi:MAG: DUF1684 domain-containing protein [Reichenbachiella sp.]